MGEWILKKLAQITHWMLTPRPKKKRAKFSGKILILPGEEPDDAAIERQTKRWKL